MTITANVTKTRGDSWDPLTLNEEHNLLLRQVAARSEDVLAATDSGRWPGRELAALLGYLRSELLRQAADEQWLLFPAVSARSTLAELYRGHVRLQSLTDALAALAASGGRTSTPPGATPELAGRRRDLAEVAATVQAIPAELERHLAAEETLLGGDVPATSALARRSHEWYPITEGPVVEVDALPAARWVDAVVDRLLRLRAGERVELRASRDPRLLWLRMDRLDPGGYGFAYIEDGPDRFRVQVTRR